MMSTILVVDDNAHMRELICELLQTNGFKVIWADDGRSGLQQVKIRLPDLIVSDLEMPTMGGLEFLHALQQDPHMAVIPFIVCSSATESAQRQQALALGAVDYLTKPFDCSMLLRSITRQLRRKAQMAHNWSSTA